MQLLEKLYDQENKFIEEIDRIEKKPDEVLFIDSGNDSGWICLKAQEDSFDWNIARLLGDWKSAKDAISEIPFEESVLLLNEETDVNDLNKGIAALSLATPTIEGSQRPMDYGLAITNNLQEIINKDFNNNATNSIRPHGKLLFYENMFSLNNKEILEINDFNDEISLPKDIIKRKASPLNSRIDDLYLFMKNSICGYCKIIKTTWHYSEIAIEIYPGYRNQGFGTALLGLMVQQFNNLGLRLSYVVEDDNIPSIKIAEKFLNKSFMLNKYLLVK